MNLLWFINCIDILERTENKFIEDYKRVGQLFAEAKQLYLLHYNA